MTVQTNYLNPQHRTKLCIRDHSQSFLQARPQGAWYCSGL
jgi:hypothetical protein